MLRKTENAIVYKGNIKYDNSKYSVKLRNKFSSFDILTTEALEKVLHQDNQSKTIANSCPFSIVLILYFHLVLFDYGPGMTM